MLHSPVLFLRDVEPELIGRGLAQREHSAINRRSGHVDARMPATDIRFRRRFLDGCRYSRGAPFRLPAARRTIRLPSRAAGARARIQPSDWEAAPTDRPKR